MAKARASVADAAADQAVMSWIGHLSELRARLIRSLIVAFVAVVGSWPAAPAVLEQLRRPVGTLVFVAPAEAFMARLQVAVAVGLLLALPYVLWEAWLFVRPGLLPHERRVLRVALPLAWLAFMLGGAVGYYALFPVGVKTLLHLAGDSVQPAVSVARYLGVFWSAVFPSALAFELPLAVVAAVALKLASLSWLRAHRGTVLFLCFVLGGMMSPQGVGMQIMLAAPLFILFELGIGLATLFCRRGIEA